MPRDEVSRERSCGLYRIQTGCSTDMTRIRHWLFGFDACYESEDGVVYTFRVIPGWKLLGLKVWAWMK